MKRVAFLVCVSILLSAPTVYALDYFGEMEANALSLKLVSTTYSRDTGKKYVQEYLIELIGGVPMLTRPQEQDKKAGTMEIVNLRKLGERENVLETESELIFTFIYGGWAQDKGKMVFRIPFSADIKDALGLLTIGSSGSLENQSWDPKNGAVAVTSGTIVGVQVSVIENTLGYGNKLYREK